MKILTLLVSILILGLNSANAQYGELYFDGNDTGFYSLHLHLDSSSQNLWQVGPPQKNIFDSAATTPNVIMTDTLSNYPVNNISRFTVKPSYFNSWGILALQWMQRLDMEQGKDGGKIEYSLDTGKTWIDAFTDPHVYNFYGYDSLNVDTLPGGDSVFTGIDSSWKNIWLCFDMYWLNISSDSLFIRFSMISDSNDTQQEGWMIDNIMLHETFIHTVNEVEKSEYMTFFPNPTNGRLHIETRKVDGPHIIEKMQLYNADGRVVQAWYNEPTKFFIDLNHHPDGVYFLKVQTNLEHVTHKIVLDR